MRRSATTKALTALAVVVVFALGACSKGESKTVALDGTPRVPDAEGVVAEVTREKLVLEDGRSFTIGEELQSFATQTMKAVPVLQRKGQYVHVGADGSHLVWVAAVGAVVDGEPRRVYYTGELEDVTDERATFVDGTVLRLRKGVRPPEAGGFVVAEIDPDARQVVSLRSP